jgi:hypothetical protein
MQCDMSFSGDAALDLTVLAMTVTRATAGARRIQGTTRWPQGDGGGRTSTDCKVRLSDAKFSFEMAEASGEDRRLRAAPFAAEGSVM